ncbi:MAG: cell division protein FtsQ/DivIB [Bilophila wadsworthia]
MGILSSSKRNNRRPARNSYTSSQRRAPSSGGGSFFAHVKSALSWTLGLGLEGGVARRLGVGGLQLYRMATTSEFFAIKRVEIRGTTHFSREEVLKAANLQSGVNSLTVNIAMEQGLRDNPWVLSVAVKRRLPDAFEIRIRERIPAFWMLKDGVLYYADNRGQMIAPVTVGNFL